MRAIILALVLAVLALSANSVALWVREAHNRQAGRTQTCQAFEGQYNAFAKVTRSGEKAETQLTYYKQHPSELRKAIAQSEHNLAVLKASIPSYCS